MPLDPLVANGGVTFETAARHACSQVPVVTPSQQVDAVLQQLAGQRYESASHIIVCGGRKFLGVVRIEDLLSAPAEATLGDLMDRDAPVVAPGIDQEIAAWHAVRKAESALSVVDREGRFLGIIPPHRLLAVLLSEHEEDLSRLGGYRSRANDQQGAGRAPFPASSPVAAGRPGRRAALRRFGRLV